MGDFNKVLSFFLGLVVVIVFVIVLSSRLNLREKFLPFADDTKAKKTPAVTITPTVTPAAAAKKEEKKGIFSMFAKKPTPTPTPTETSAKAKENQAVNQQQVNRYQDQMSQANKANNVKQIPNTGAPTLVFPLASSLALLGFYLRKKA